MAHPKDQGAGTIDQIGGGIDASAKRGGVILGVQGVQLSAEDRDQALQFLAHGKQGLPGILRNGVDGGGAFGGLPLHVLACLVVLLQVTGQDLQCLTEHTVGDIPQLFERTIGIIHCQLVSGGELSMRYQRFRIRTIDGGGSAGQYGRTQRGTGPKAPGRSMQIINGRGIAPDQFGSVRHGRHRSPLRLVPKSISVSCSSATTWRANLQPSASAPARSRPASWTDCNISAMRCPCPPKPWPVARCGKLGEVDW
ncbi:hypothetical protein FRX94_10835 [Corynebacterium canis]|uniref:Uncharacterized protein n=1 Tax=Corynebacterium canis TaxID=679663 RepID=A0A5C5UB74_9CORY|nr:hypothetical protein FRX94_10835 [Corynebacterium canis]